jgi:hypothetical protein
MASINEHLIAAYCFINGIKEKLNYRMSFINAARLPAVLVSEDLKLTENDITRNLENAMVKDESQFTSHYGILLDIPKTANDISQLLISVTISYIWKRDDDIEFYIDNIKEPYTVHSKSIVKYIENSDIDKDNFDNLVFDLTNSGELINPYTNFYDLLAHKIAENEIVESPLTYNGRKIGKINYASDRK